jgi:predicted O-methyltransferase YrrM
LDGPIDFVLNDADKENCRRYVELLLPKMSSGGMILTDNTTTHAEQLAGFLDWVRRHPEVHSSEIPLGNGMELTTRH